jgi:hypothetical protein
MTEKPKREEKPWRPRIDREPELNPSENRDDRTGALENPPPPVDDDQEEESGS